MMIIYIIAGIIAIWLFFRLLRFSLKLFLLLFIIVLLYMLLF